MPTMPVTKVTISRNPHKNRNRGYYGWNGVIICPKTLRYPVKLFPVNVRAFTAYIYILAIAFTKCPRFRLFIVLNHKIFIIFHCGYYLNM